MNYFWPRRPNPKGFSIEKVPEKYRDKISKIYSEPSNLTVIDQQSPERVLNKNSSDQMIDKFKTKTIHWANRQFEEYKNVA